MSENELPLQDITGPEEIRQMVDRFYESIQADDTLGPIFQEKVADWSQHLPTMYAFWESLLFGGTDYRGNPFAKHMSLPVGPQHFERWIELFLQTIDALFAGPKAEHAKGAAKSIAHSFQVRMGIGPGAQRGQFF